MFVVVPYMLFVIAGVVVIFISLRDRQPPSTPNLTARRKHPLRHLQVELNRVRKTAQETARKTAQETAPEEQGDGKSEGKPAKPRRRRDGPGGLRRLK